MQGEHVSLWAYSRGEAARDLPYQLWKMVEDAGDWGTLFWVDTFDKTRVPMFGDLTHWVHFMHSLEDPKLFMLSADNETGALIGFIWVNRIIAGASCYGSIWMHPDWRGKPHCRETGALGIRWVHELLALPTLYTITPHVAVRNFDKKIGFQELGQIPEQLFGVKLWLLEHKHG